MSFNLLLDYELSVYGSQVPLLTISVPSVPKGFEYFLTSIEIKRAGYIKAFEFYATTIGIFTLKVF